MTGPGGMDFIGSFIVEPYRIAAVTIEGKRYIMEEQLYELLEEIRSHLETEERSDGIMLEEIERRLTDLLGQ